MKKRFLILLVASSIFTSCSNDSEDLFVPPAEIPAEEEPKDETPDDCLLTTKDGLLIIEGESFDLKGQWDLLSDTKASGGKYIQYNGANSYNTQNLSNEITVKFYIPEAGGYRVKWFMRQPLEEATGDLANDVWIYFPGDIGRAWVNDESMVLEHYEKFVSRSEKDGEFAFGGALDLHDPKSSSWLTVSFPEAGEYTLKICARSSHFQLDKIVLSVGLDNEVVKETSKDITETTTCD